MKGTKNGLQTGPAPSYGSFSERCKYDDYNRRKYWFRRNRARLMTSSAIIVIGTAAALLYVFAK